MVDLTLALDDAAMQRRYGAPTFARALEYARRGRVLSASHETDEDGDIDIRGIVAGSTGVPYVTDVSLGAERDGVWIAERCSCPVGVGCKHAVALLLTVRSELAFSGPDRQAWQRQLDSLLDELDTRRGNPTTGVTPLALQVDLQRRVARRWQSRPDESARGDLRVRPLQRGARDNWIKTGVSWQQVPYLGAQRQTYDPRQVTALTGLLEAYRLASRATYYGPESHLTLSWFGPTLWRCLEQLREAGVALVPGSGLAGVGVGAEPVALRLDVNADDRDASLALGVRHGEEWYARDTLDVLGQDGHGVALWQAAGKAGWHVTLAPLESPATPALRRLLAAGPVMVPGEQREDLLGDYLPRLQQHVSVISSDGSVPVPDPVLPRLALTVSWLAVDEVRIAWSWRYRVGDDDRVYGLDETRGTCGIRRIDRERRLLDELVLDDDQVHLLCDAHRRKHGLVAQRSFTHGEAVAFATEVLPGLEQRGQVEITEEGARPDYHEAREAPVVHFASRGSAGGDEGTDGRTDWLDLEVLISVDGQSLALAQLLEALTLGREQVVLANGLYVSVDRPEFARLAALVAAAGELHEQPRDGVRVGHHDLGLWGELAEVGIVDAQAGEWVTKAQALRTLSMLPEVEPTGLKAELRSYQHDGFRWLAFLWQAGLGGVLADDMGLGKTIQTLALVAHARDRGARPFLVVAPTSVVATWVHEAAEFTPGLLVRAVTESHSRRGTSLADLAEGADLVVASYTLFRLEVDDYVAQQWGGLVLDEAQTVKNHTGKTHQCVRRVDAPFRLALTGTPMENRLMELWSLLSIVAPGLYPWPQRFNENVAIPVERLRDAEVLDRFRRRIRPFLLRRTKELVAADLPAKQEQVLQVTLTPRHRKVYETHLQRERQAVLGLVGDFDKHRIAIFRSLTKMRQLSLDAALVDAKYDGIGSAKVDVLLDHLTELVAEGHRALVFSQFTSFLTRTRARLHREGIATTYLDGSTRRRSEVIDGFKAGDAPVFLISLKAGGVGLTLTEADYVFVLDPWWNPAVEAQAVDRAHRIGQTRPVMVYRLVAEQTIEEKVMELKARKQALFTQVVDGDGAMASAIDADDVRALFDG